MDGVAVKQLWSVSIPIRSISYAVPLALPPGELPPQAAERVLAVTFSVYPLRLRFAQTPLPEGEARGGYAPWPPLSTEEARMLFSLSEDHLRQNGGLAIRVLDGHAAEIALAAAVDA